MLSILGAVFFLLFLVVFLIRPSAGGKPQAAHVIMLIGTLLLVSAMNSTAMGADPQTVRLLVVPVDFPDIPGTMDFSVAEAEWVDPMVQFFDEVSNGALDLQVTLVPRVSRMEHPRRFYHCDGDFVPAPGEFCTQAWRTAEPLATLIADGLIDSTSEGLSPHGSGPGMKFDIILFINARNVPAGCGSSAGLLGGAMFPPRRAVADTGSLYGRMYHLGYATYISGPCDTACEINWGAAAHEVGHALNKIIGGGYNRHPAGYKSAWELMDSAYPCSPGIFTRVSRALLGRGMPQFFPGWIPDDSITVFNPMTSAGGTEIIAPVEFDPAATTSPLGLKVETSDGTNYFVECRHNIFPERTGCYEDSVLIIKSLPFGEIDPDTPSKVNQLQLATGFSDSNPDPLCTRVCSGSGSSCTEDVDCPTGETCEYALDQRRWKSHFLPGDSFSDTANDLQIDVGPFVPGGSCTVTVTYGPAAASARPDVALLPWLSEPMSTYETVDIWVDSECNGYEEYDPLDTTRLKYGKRPDGTVIHNGDDPCLDHHNRLYATVRNLGTAPADDVVVHFDHTDPLGVGIWGATGWVQIGTATEIEFPELASIPAGGTATVWVDWVPDSADVPFFDGTFNYHSCVRVRVDSVLGEVLLANQDGDREQENIDFFEIRRDLDVGTYREVDRTLRLKNDANTVERFVLAVETAMPPDWNLSVGDGSERYALGPGETLALDVHMEVPYGTPVGQGYFAEVSAFALRPDASPNASIDLWEPELYSGLMFEARTVHASRFIAMGAQPNPPESCIPASLALSGCLEPAVSGVLVTLDYLPPDGSPAISRQTPTDANGCFSDVLSIALTGDWGVRAIFQGIAEFGSAVSDLIPVPVYDPADVDCDLVPNGNDNCPLMANPGQGDLDTDGAGDVCDCSPQDGDVFAVPDRASDLVLAKNGVNPDTDAEMVWDSLASMAGSGTVYDVASGKLNGLAETGLVPEECTADDLPSPGVTASHALPPGEGVWYLVRGQNSCGDGSWDGGGTGQVEPRDGALANVCP